MQSIVLDIGNVICEWNPQRLAACAFADPDDHEQALEDTVNHPDWLDLDRGKISLAQAIENAQARSALKPKCIERIYRALPVSLEPLTSTVGILDKVVAAGIKLHVLSNMQHHAWQFLQSTHPFWEYFDTVVVSCDTGFIKPEPEIFRYLVDKAKLDPADSVFIDDMRENVLASREFGLPAVQLQDRHEGGSLLAQLLVIAVDQEGGALADRSLPDIWPQQQAVAAG